MKQTYPGYEMTVSKSEGGLEVSFNDPESKELNKRKRLFLATEYEVFLNMLKLLSESQDRKKR